MSEIVYLIEILNIRVWWEVSMKKLIFKVFCICIIFVISGAYVGEVNATSGKLKSATICQDSNGVYYGNHGDGHWHVASSRDSGWYPQG